jgi:hypothetical protein
MKKNIFLVIVFSLLFILANDIVAQCPMCKMAADSNMKAGGTAGIGLNRGILYILSIPYLLVAGIAYYWWRNRRAAGDESNKIAENHLFSEN